MGSWQEHLVPYQHVTYWHTICYSREPKTDKCQEGRKLFTYPKNKRAETRIDSSLERALEVFEQISEDMGQKKTPEILSQTEGDRLKSQTFLSENQEFVFGLVEEFGVL